MASLNNELRTCVCFNNKIKRRDFIFLIFSSTGNQGVTVTKFFP